MQATVAQILAERPPVRKAPTNDVFLCAKKMRIIATLLDRLLAAVRTGDEVERDEDFEAIHDALLLGKSDSINHRTKDALAVGGFVFPTYVDPNASYEEDVQAWIKAFRDIHAQVEARRDALANR